MRNPTTLMLYVKTIGLSALICFLSMSFPGFGIAADGAVGDGYKLLFDCGPLVAFIDGEKQDESKATGVAFCLGLMQGMLHMNNYYEYNQKGATLFCQPDGNTIGQAARIVVKYLQEHPEELHKRESMLAIEALRVAFPCASIKK